MAFKCIINISSKLYTRIWELVYTLFQMSLEPIKQRNEIQESAVLTMHGTDARCSFAEVVYAYLNNHDNNINEC